MPDQPMPCVGASTAYRALLDTIVGGTAGDPPCVERLALPKPTAWAPGWIESVTTISHDVVWPGDAVFGGYLTCIADLFAGLVMLTVLSDRARFLTAALDTTFHHPTLPGPLRIEAEIGEMSSRKATAHVRFHQGGKVTAEGRASQTVLCKAGTPWA